MHDDRQSSQILVDHDKRSVVEKRAAASLGTCGVGPESGEEVRSRDTRPKNHFPPIDERI